MALNHKKIRPCPLPTATPGPHPKRKKMVKGNALVGVHKAFYADVQRHRHQEWRAIVAAYEATPGDFVAAHHYLDHHPIFHWFTTPKNTDVPYRHERNLVDDCGVEDIVWTVVKVNPKTRRISKTQRKNTEARVWFEFGPREWRGDTSEPTINPNLCGGAATYEKAIIKVARLVHRHYGNDRRLVSDTAALAAA